MQFLKDFDPKPVNILKLAGLAVVAIIVVVFAVRLIGSSFGSVSSGMGDKGSAGQAAPMASYDMAYSGTEEMAYVKSGGAALSIRNATAPTVAPQAGQATMGSDAESLEVTEYTASIETRKLADTCARITGLKAREDVIFENAGEYEHGCNYTFKAKRASVAEILALIEALDPKELDANTYTIKNIVDDYTSELEILEKKKATIEATLADAIQAYDDITRLATKVSDVESLARIIDSKIGIIERLTQERLNVSSQLDRLARSKAEQLDRLEYTYFYVNVYENKFIDGQDLKDSWKAALKSFVQDINRAIQDITVNLVAVLFAALQYVIYFFILLIIAKYGWRLAQRIWKK